MTLGRAASASFALHALVLLLLVAGGLLRPERLPEPMVLAKVELVEQQTPTVGAASVAAHPAPAPQKPAIERAAPAKPLPLRHVRVARLPLPAPPAPSVPRPAHAAPSPARAANRTEAAGTGLVSGRQIVPAAINRAARNIPPAYPPMAVRAGEEGSVILRVRVAPDGSGAVAIAQSSGYALLDDAARTAVARWHFIPALSNGKPVSSAMLVRIRFILTAPEGGQ
jgi:periplasmic protein TonB